MRYGLWLGVLCMLAGCGGGASGTKVTGNAAYSDGTALSKGVITLTGETGTFSGMVGSDGVYTLEDVAAGDYTVVVTGVMDKEGNNEMTYDANGNYVAPKPGDAPKSLISDDYSDSEKSPLKIKVPSENYDISVEKKP